MSKSPITFKIALPTQTLNLTLDEMQLLKQKLSKMLQDNQEVSASVSKPQEWEAKVYTDKYGIIGEKQLKSLLQNER